jgi:hypothetical protein
MREPSAAPAIELPSDDDLIDFGDDSVTPAESE